MLSVIITNYHVIEDAKAITTNIKNKELDATVVAKDPANDIAIIKVNYYSKPLPMKPSSSISKGSEVMTLGYPLIDIQGQEQKATFGHINSLSGVGGDIRFLQIDVPIQPGNSGGPLIAKDGNVIGIITATLDQVNTLKKTGSLPQNVNYAVKSEYIFPLINSIGINLATINTGTKTFSFEEIIKNSEAPVVLIISK